MFFSVNAPRSSFFANNCQSDFEKLSVRVHYRKFRLVVVLTILNFVKVDRTFGIHYCREPRSIYLIHFRHLIIAIGVELRVSIEPVVRALPELLFPFPAKRTLVLSHHTHTRLVRAMRGYFSPVMYSELTLQSGIENQDNGLSVKGHTRLYPRLVRAVAT